MSVASVISSPWFSVGSRRADVFKAMGYARVEWPSGRQTLEFYGVSVEIPDAELQTVASLRRLRADKERQAFRKLEEFRERTTQIQWLVRAKGRKKARQFRDIEWLDTQHYSGPMPSQPGRSLIE